MSTILPKLQVSAEVVTDIINAINAGKVVTVPQANIDFYGWIGTGYIVQDPATGAAAYLISGGTNGAFLPLIDCLMDFVFAPPGLTNWTILLNSANSIVSGATTISSSSNAGAEADIMDFVLYAVLAALSIFIPLLLVAIGGGPVAIVLIGLLVNILLKITLFGLNCSSNLTPAACPPWWCSLPCAGFISDWFTGISILSGWATNAQNPCY